MTATPAHDRLFRILAIAAGAGSVLFLLLALGAISEQAGSMVPGFFVPLTIAFYLLPVVLAVASRFASIRALRVIAGFHAGVAAVLLIGWMPAMTTAILPNSTAPWPLNSLAIATITATLAFAPRVAWTYLVLLCVGGGVLRYFSFDRYDFAIPVQDFMSMLSFGTIVTALIVVTLRAGREQDAAALVTRNEASTAAESASRAQQRVRFGSFVHDHVITTLLAAAHNHDGSKEAIRTSARVAIDRLDEFVGTTRTLVAVDPSVLARDLRNSHAAAAVFDGDFDAFGGLVPPHVVDAVGGAVAESLRNSLRHAASGTEAVERRVWLSSTPLAISVAITDDGVGFDLDAVPPERLGIRTSVIARMSVVAGGSATVSSIPGTGTRVFIEWQSEAGA